MKKDNFVFGQILFEINVSNDFHFFTPSDSMQDITLFAKYTMRTEELFRNRVIGGTFEGSNDIHFREKDILYRIDKKPERLQTVARSFSSKAYRYVRYVGPENAHCNIAEVLFYMPGDIPLKGKVIGTPGCLQKDGSHEYTNVFDGDYWTSYDYKEIDFYLTKINEFGCPLDNRHTYTKTDWTVWTASLTTDSIKFQKLILPLHKFMNETNDRVPMADLINTDQATVVDFRGRSVVGGYFIRLLENAFP